MISTPVLDAITGDTSSDGQEQTVGSSQIALVAHWCFSTSGRRAGE